MGCCTRSTKLCTALMLVGINLLILAGGVLLIVEASYMKTTGWMEVVSTHWSSANKIINGMQILGGILIGLSALGIVGACCRWRAGLLAYSIIMLLVAIVFAVAIGFAFTLEHKANDWKSKSYPAIEGETKIKTEFDRIYCYAQGAYICNQMSATEAVSTFLPEAGSAASLLNGLGSLRGLNAMCGFLLPVMPSLKSVCDGCTKAKEFKKFSSVLDWANDQCPRQRNTLLWCGNYLATNDAASVTVGTAPYTVCRPPFLDLLSGVAFLVGVACVLVTAGGLLVVLFACYLRRTERSEQQYETILYGPSGTPQPQTTQPIQMHGKV